MSKTPDYLVQVQLSRTNQMLRTTWYKTCLIDLRDDIKAGNLITLKDDEIPDREWTIETVSQPIPKASVNRTWNNNI